MALENGNGNGMVMPVSPMMGGGYNDGWGFGGGGWWPLLFLFAMFGNNGRGFGGDGMMPYFFNAQTQNDVNRGFDNNGLSNQIASLQASVNNIPTNNQLNAIQGALSDAEVANCNRAMNQMQTSYTNQIADMNQRFSLATAVDDRIDNLAMSLQKCCCDNELATERLRNDITRSEANIITNNTANTQAVLDKLCQLELDGVRAERDNLRTQLQSAQLAASQAAQTGQLMADNAQQTQNLINRIAPYPQPSFIVGNPYVSYPYYNNGYNNGCGCGGFNQGIA